MNPAGFAYSVILLRDCLIVLMVIYLEVPMLNEKDRSGESVTMAADSKINSFSFDSYVLDLYTIILMSKKKTEFILKI